MEAQIVSLYSFSIVGFFMSVMYPVIFSLALSSVSEDHGSFAGILVTGIIGGAVVQLLIGGLGNLFGLRAACVLFISLWDICLALVFGRNLSLQTKLFSIKKKFLKRSDASKASDHRLKNSMKEKIIGIDLGATNIRGAVV